MSLFDVPQILPDKVKPHIVKKYFKIFINFNYIVGFLYAFYFFVTTSRKEQMFVRRLWAFECWIILSFYGLFIYLFYLEKSALEDRRGLFRFMKIQALGLIGASKQELLSYFDYIASNPEDYSFDSHKGVEVISGSLTEADSIFKTKEKFLGITLELKFRVTKVDQDKGFEFELLDPKFLSWLGIRGKFSYKALDRDEIRLELVIFNNPQDFFTRIISAAFYLSLARLIVAHQINKEVGFIGREIEARAQGSEPK